MNELEVKLWEEYEKFLPYLSDSSFRTEGTKMEKTIKEKICQCENVRSAKSNYSTR